MDLFLKIVGAVFVAFILLIVAIVIAFKIFRHKLKKAFEGFAEQLGDVEGMHVPTRIHLERKETPEWKDPEKAGSLVRELLDLGFQDAGYYHPRESRLFRIHGFVKPNDSATAAVYEHNMAGVITDLVTRYVDGTSVTYTTVVQGGELPPYPGHPKVRLPEATPTELYRRMMAERPAGTPMTITAEQFREHVERVYAEEMDWRNTQPVTEAEIRANVPPGEEVSDEVIEETRQLIQAQRIAGLQEALQEHFQTNARMTIAEWEEARDRLVFVHDLLPLEQVTELVQEWTGSEDDESEDEEEEVRAPDVPPGTTSRQAFEILNSRLPEKRRFRKLDEVSKPVPADVYVAPEWEEEEEE